MKEGEIAKEIKNLIETMKSLGLYNNLKDFNEKIKSFKKEQEFYSFLEDLRINFGSCSGCKKEGLPFCEIRQCAQTKKIDICSNCASFDICEKIKKDQWQYELLLDIKEKGYRNWLAEI